MRHGIRTIIVAGLVFSTTALIGCSQSQTAKSSNQFASSSKTTVPPATKVNAKEFMYTYYPDQQVYFNTQNSTYFWQTSDGWTSGNTAPASFSLHNARHVSFPLSTDTPFQVHASIVSAFPANPRATASVNLNQ